VKRYPVFLNLKGKKAVVLGAGEVAFRKIKELLASQARVEVTSREFLPSVVSLAKKNPYLRLRPKTSLDALLKGADLAFAATSDVVLNKKFALACRKKRILVNVADQPDLCDFLVPSLFRKGRLELAISTGGASPLLAKKLREELSQKIRPEAIRLLNRMGRLRRGAKSKLTAPKKRRDFFEGQIQQGFHFLSQRKTSQ